MTVIVDALLLLAALFLFLPVAMLFLECIAALSSAARPSVSAERPRHVAVLIPAHNEALGIAAMLQALLPELAPDTRAVVIADNCTDATAQITRRFGVTALERDDPKHIGKSYALAYGMEFLAANPPDVVIILDADCLIAPGALDRIARLAYASARPVQAVYLLDPPPNARPAHLLSAFAFRVKNLVRPAGLARLGMPCFLMGSGMAFPWDDMRTAPLGSGKIVEDYWLTVELAGRGHLPLLDADARVLGRMPASARGARTQRTRWEHGHLDTILHGAPRLASVAWRQKRLAPLWLMLDLSVPPLSLLVTVWGGNFALSIGAYGLGFSVAPLAWNALNGVLLVSAIVAAWWKYGRGEFPIAALLAAPTYILSKLSLYSDFLLRRQTEWERSERQARTAPVEPVFHND